MSAAPPPRASANAPRPITASSPGLRRFGNPATLPLRWMPDRMRADVLALHELIVRRPLAGITYSLGVAAALSMTLFMLAAAPSGTELAAVDAETSLEPEPATFQ